MKKLFACVLSLLLLSTNAFALVLEDLPQDKLHQLLSGKRIGFYIGSFDPIHKGHEQLVENIINQDLVDYCLVYPAWGGDEYKNRADVNVRLDMLFGLYKDNSSVIVTRLTPIQLQKRLTVDAPYNISGKPAVESSIKDTQYIGILGSDTALDTVADKKKLSVFMRGVKIPEKYHENTIGGIIALPVTNFVVSLREGDNIDTLGNMIGDRKIIATIKPTNNTASSTIARNKIKQGEDVSGLLSPEVVKIIEHEKLYK